MSDIIEPPIVTSQLGLGINPAFSQFAVAAPTFTPIQAAPFATFTPPPVFAPSGGGAFGANALNIDTMGMTPATAGFTLGNVGMVLTGNPALGLMLGLGTFGALQFPGAFSTPFVPTDGVAVPFDNGGGAGSQ